MLDTALHIGIDHPDFLWIALPAFLTFVSGLVLGARTEQIREWTGTGASETAE
ncbi:hypothetical protein [Halovenus halobia]|uniref:hypothetical protein n=1 Tax=Halovenus halobia TaxID=3396622 RepID=UPI003F5577B3